MVRDVILAETIRYHERMLRRYNRSLILYSTIWHMLQRELRTESDFRIRERLSERALYCYDYFLYQRGMRDYHCFMIDFWRRRVETNGTFIARPRMPSRREYNL